MTSLYVIESTFPSVETVLPSRGAEASWFTSVPRTLIDLPTLHRLLKAVFSPLPSFPLLYFPFPPLPNPEHFLYFDNHLFTLPLGEK